MKRAWWAACLAVACGGAEATGAAPQQPAQRANQDAMQMQADAERRAREQQAEFERQKAAGEAAMAAALADAERKHKTDQAAEQLQSALRSPFAAGEGSARAEKIVALYKDLRALDDARAKQAEPQVKAWLDEAARVQAAEKACQADPKCLDKRAAAPVCEATEERDALRQQLALAQRNPSGVRDLRELHNLGRAIQGADATIAESKRAFADARKKPFSAALCK